MQRGGGVGFDDSVVVDDDEAGGEVESPVGELEAEELGAGCGSGGCEGEGDAGYCKS